MTNRFVSVTYLLVVLRTAMAQAKDAMDHAIGRLSGIFMTDFNVWDSWDSPDYWDTLKWGGPDH